MVKKQKDSFPYYYKVIIKQKTGYCKQNSGNRIHQNPQYFILSILFTAFFILLHLSGCGSLGFIPPNQKDDLQKDIKKINEEVKSLKSEIGKVNDELGKRLNSEIGKATSELGNKINSETGKVTDELGKRLNSEIGKAASELGNKINSETGKVTDELEKRLNSEVSKVTDKLENINNQLRQNTNVVEATKTEYTGIKKTISEMDKVALETRAGQIEIKKTISNINGILEITKKNQADLKLEIDKLNEGFQQTASKIDEYVFRISNLNQRLDSIDVRLAQFSDIYKATAERGKKEDLALKEISQKLNSMETGLVSLRSEISAIKREINTVNGKILEFIRNEGGKEKLVSENSPGDIKKGDAKIIPEQPGPEQGQVSVNQTHHVKELHSPTEESDPNESHLIVAMKPEEIFNTAYSDFLKGSFQLAITEFKSYIEKYPDTELAGKSQYWIGECYYSIGEFEKAILEFNEGISRYPKNVRVPSVMLKIADSRIKMNQISDASNQLKEIIKRYPSSDEAKQAKERLLSIEKH